MNAGFRVVGITPFETPDTRLVLTLLRAGAVGVLDLGRDIARGLQTTRELLEIGTYSFGVRVPDASLYSAEDFPETINLVVLDAINATMDLTAWRKPGREIWLQVCSLTEAKAALLLKPDGLIVKGSESGGRVGSDTSFILLQEVRKLGVPFWVQGGIGIHSTAACFVGGAKGVVLDSQLCLLRGCTASEEIKKALANADGTETKILHGHQIFTRPDLDIPAEEKISSDDFRARLGAQSLKTNFLPAGQDIALARRISERHLSIRSFVNSLKRSASGHLSQARALSVIGPNSQMAKAYGTEFAIAQGPMTRVSDKAEFIDAVANSGALPFLALSLLRKTQAREILSETAALLGSKPWGVGILGFVLEDLQREQLEVLADFNPSALLIAGGRPSQTEVFEKRGIRTFLHVPSPGLLKQFLKEGARRFVFEGRECGGHVGPRSSFILWESQIEVLMSFESVHEVEVFFAGGIHDSLSGAMVATMAAPLVARGAKVGALIGTAYLFTQEAVESGAIQQEFQNQALACEKTALLESGPGHATRCALTPFVEKFEAKRLELKAAGMEAKKIWAELESLNVGRLRVASKGVERSGDKLISVDQSHQRKEGLFMLGQVAQLRSGVCSMRELHIDITEGSTKFLQAIEIKHAKIQRRSDVAVVGMACIMPGAKSLSEYWKNILAGTNAVTEVPDGRWSKEDYYDGTASPGKSLSKWGAFIDESEFDPIEYGIPPNSMGSIEPVQLLSLKVAKQALMDAGYESKEFDRERTSVIFGAEAGTDLGGAYGFRSMFQQYVGEMPKELDDFLPTLNEDSFPGVLANVISGRIANRLDLGGSNYTVDAACGSSLAALDLSVKELLAGESDMVLCGGADFHNSINDYLMFSSVKALSNTGKSQPFSADANGIVLGEGVAVIVLKRLYDAIRDNDRIYAVVKGVGSSSDGKSLGLTAPRKEGQMRALHRAYQRAGLSPSEIGLVEAHGTGTVVGDRTELETLTEVFSEAGSLGHACALGSVKSQIGHTKCTAGIAGLIKTCLSLYHAIVPPTISIEKPNPGYRRESSPFFFTAKPLPWLADIRRAGVSAFGFGGTNFHTVVTSHDTKKADPVATCSWTAELFLFDNTAEVVALSEVLQKGSELDLSRLAKTVSIDKKSPRIAIVARDLTDLSAKLILAAREEDSKGIFFAQDMHAARGKVAFLFSGQGSQRINMGGEIFNAFPHLRKYLKLGEKWTPFIFPNGINPQSEIALKQTSITQPALGIVELALWQLTQDLKIKPDMFAGHSYGELVALCAAGSIPEDTLLPLSEARGQAIESAAVGVTGSMAAIFADEQTVTAELKDLCCVIANHNAPTQLVISGFETEIDEAVRRFAAKNIRAQKLQVSCAFHSPVVFLAEKEFAKVLKTVDFSGPAKPVYANSTAMVYESEKIAETLARQIVEPVQFVKQVQKMYEDGARVFIEIGPGSALKNLVGQILGDKPHFAQTLDRSEMAIEQLLLTLGQLTSVGVSFDPNALFADRKLEPYDFKKIREQKMSGTTWLINGHLAKPRSGTIPRSALKPGKMSVRLVGVEPVTNAPISNADESRENVVRNYLAGMNQIIEGQRQVMLQYLGAAVSTQSVTAETRALAPVKPAAIAKSEVVAVEAPTQAAELNVATIVLQVVSQKTGYPEEMLGLDQDLEADLSIDSIKRFEILAELGDKLGMSGSGAGQGGLDKLSTIKTLRILITTLEGRMQSQIAQPHAGADSEAVSEPQVSIPVNQFLFRIEESPLGPFHPISFENRAFVIVEDHKGVSHELVMLLEKNGASVRLVKAGQPWSERKEDRLHGLILLSMLDDAWSKPLEVFKTLQDVSKKMADTVIGVTGRGGHFGYSGSSSIDASAMGISGLFKSFAKECEDKTVKVIDVDLEEDPAKIAQQIFTELQSANKLVEVGYEDGIRRRLVAVPLISNLEQEKLNLDKNSVILMLGGARGIGAKTAIKLAEEYGCHFEIIGKSPFPTAENPATVALADHKALRAYFIKNGQPKKPAEIEAACKKILQEREIRGTFARLESLGSRPIYHSFDVRDKKRLGECIDALYGQGPIDGVIHAAGVLSDSLHLDKSDEAFARVYETKVNPAEVLAEKLRNDVKFVALFSSVSGCFGNRGQTDYAAANNSLDYMARVLGERIEGRTVSFNWGPWAETGMVTVELENEYRRRGIGLIPPGDGTQKFLDELKFGDRKNKQVVIMSGSPESFE